MSALRAYEQDNLYSTNLLAADGTRILDMRTNMLWLVLSGQRHHIASSAVYNSLFFEKLQYLQVRDIRGLDLPVGFPFSEGTCLVKSAYCHKVYILTAINGRAVLLHVPSVEVAEKYGLDPGLATDIPSFLMNSLPKPFSLA